MSVQTLLALSAAGGAMCMDFIQEKVINGFIYLGLAAGVLLHVYQTGWEGFLSFCAGAALPILILAPLFYFHMLGAGDIKLFSVLGGILGPASVLELLGVSFFLGALLSFFFLISCGNMKERLLYLARYFYRYCQTGRPAAYREGQKGAEEFHFTVPIFLGTMLYAGGFY